MFGAEVNGFGPLKSGSNRLPLGLDVDLVVSDVSPAGLDGRPIYCALLVSHARPFVQASDARRGSGFAGGGTFATP